MTRILIVGAGLAAAAALAGCGSMLKVPEKYAVPAAAACIDEELAGEISEACPLLLEDAELLELDDYKVLQALRADRLKALRCIAKQGAAVLVCSKVPASTGTPPGR